MKAFHSVFDRLKIITRYWSGNIAEPSLPPVQFQSSTQLHYPLPDTTVFQWIGFDSVLPPAFTDTILKNISEKEPALHDFLQVLTQRLSSLWYHGWIKRHPGSDYWMQDRILKGWLQHFDPLMPAPLLAYHFLTPFSPHHSAKQLEHIIQCYWNIPCVIKENTGRWIDIPVIHRCVLSAHQETAALRKIHIGQKIWMPAAAITLHLQPLTSAQYFSLIKGGPARKILKTLVQSFLPKTAACILKMKRITRSADRLAWRRGRTREIIITTCSNL